MPVEYQRHGRRHAADGEDPVPFNVSIPYVRMVRSTLVSVATDADEYLDWNSTLNQGGSAYFDETFVDGSGVEGVKILQPGIYAFQASTLVTEDNAGNVVPPTLCYHLISALDGVADFSDAMTYVSGTEGWLKHYPAGAYTPPTSSPFASAKVHLGGAFTLPVLSSDLSFRDCFSCRIFSEGSTGAWKYGPSYLHIARLGDIAA